MKPESIVKVSETVGYHDLIVNMIRRQGGGHRAWVVKGWL